MPKKRVKSKNSKIDLIDSENPPINLQIDKNLGLFKSKIIKLEFRLRLIMLLLATLILIGTLNLGFLYYKSQTNNPFNETTKTLATAINKPTFNKPYQVNINSFYENAAISEVAYQLELKKQSISTNNTTNCSTPEIPPIANGCSFVIRPYASKIQVAGSYLLNLIFDAKLNPDDKIAVDLKDTDKNELTTSLGTIRGKDSRLIISLPPQLKPSEQLFVRLWPQKGSVVTINEISIEHLEYTQLQPVKLKLSPDTIKNNQDKKLSVYLDPINSGKYDKNTSLLWNCNHNFPGVQPITINQNNEYLILRDDSCVQNNILPEWKKDNFENSLAAFSYLAILDLGLPTQQVFNFEVIPSQNEYQL